MSDDENERGVLQREPSFAEQLQDEPWRFDFYAVMRRLERSFRARADRRRRGKARRICRAG